MSRRLLVIAGLASLLLGGCGADPEPRIGTAPSSSAATPTPTPTETVAESPEAFIKRWQQASTDMQNTGDVSAFDTLNSPGCSACTRLIKLVEDYYAAGGSVQTEPWTILSVEEQASGVFSVRIEAAPSRVVPSAGATPQQAAGGKAAFLFTLKQEGSTWSVAEFEQQAS